MDFRPAVYPQDLVAIEALVESAAKLDNGVGPLGEAALADLGAVPGSGSFGFLATNAGLCGYVHAMEAKAGLSAELALDGRHRSASVTGPLLAALSEEAAARGYATIGLWVHTDDVSELVPSTGEAWTLNRTLSRLQTHLPPSFQADFPPGTIVRDFRIGRDEAAWLELNNAAFLGHPEQGGWTDADLVQRFSRSWFDPQGLRMAWFEGALVAFNWTKLEQAGSGEIYVIASSPAHRAKGLGRAIALEGLWDLSTRRNASTATLYVESANQAAGRLYQDLGFSPIETHRFYLGKPPGHET